MEENEKVWEGDFYPAAVVYSSGSYTPDIAIKEAVFASFLDAFIFAAEYASSSSTFVFTVILL